MFKYFELSHAILVFGLILVGVVNSVGLFVGTPFTLPHLDERKAGLADIIAPLGGVCSLLVEGFTAANIVTIIRLAGFTPMPPYDEVLLLTTFKL
jgi:hypothetical protein